MHWFKCKSSATPRSQGSKMMTAFFSNFRINADQLLFEKKKKIHSVTEYNPLSKRNYFIPSNNIRPHSVFFKKSMI